MRYMGVGRRGHRKAKIMAVLEGQNDFLTAKQIYILLSQKYRYTDGISSSHSLAQVLCRYFDNLEKKKVNNIFSYKLKTEKL